MKKLFYSKFNTNSSQYNKSNNITSQSSPFTLDRVITDNNIDIELTNQTSENSENNENAV